MELTEEESIRLQHLYDIAVDRFLDKTDFCAVDWLYDEELKEYNELFNKEYEDEN